MKTARIIPLGGALAALALLTACAAPAPAPVPGTSDGAAPDPVASSPAAEPEASGPECLIGDWIIPQDQMQGFYDAVGSIEFEIEGDTGLSFTETDYRYTPDFALTMEIAGMQATGAITGSVTGEYTADDSTITTSHEVSDVAVTITVGGVTQDGTDAFGDFMSSAPINSAPYECTPEGPVIQFDTGDSRVPVQLRAG